MSDLDVKRLVVCLITAAAVMAVTHPGIAQAQSFPGERRGDTQLQANVDAALVRWAARGVTGCRGGVIALFADELHSDRDHVDADGRALPCRGDAWDWPGYVWIHSRVRFYPEWFRAAWECDLTEHEVGHALGLSHDDGAIWPVMRAGTSPYSAECATLIRRDLEPGHASLQQRAEQRLVAERRARARARRALRRASITIQHGVLRSLRRR